MMEAQPSFPMTLSGTRTTPFGIPPFDRIAPEHFRPAFEVALSEQRAEIERIAREAAAPSFDNTLAALERSGWALKRVGGVFQSLERRHERRVAGDRARDGASSRSTATPSS